MKPRSTDIRNHPDPRYCVFGQTLTNALELKNRSQTDLSRFLSYNKSTISRMCRGMILPDSSTLSRVQSFFSDVHTKLLLKCAYDQALLESRSNPIHAPPGQDPVETIRQAMRDHNLHMARKITLHQRKLAKDPEIQRTLIELQFEQNLLLDNLSECPKLISQFPVPKGSTELLYRAQKETMKGMLFRFVGWDKNHEASLAFIEAEKLLRMFQHQSEEETLQKRRTYFTIRIQSSILGLSQVERNPNLVDKIETVSQSISDLKQAPLAPREKAECIEAQARCHVIRKNTKALDETLAELRQLMMEGTSSLPTRVHLLMGKSHLLKSQLDEAMHSFELALSYASTMKNRHHRAQAERMVALVTLARS